MKAGDHLQRLCDQLANVLLVLAGMGLCVVVYCLLDDVSYTFSRFGQVLVEEFYISISIEAASILFTVCVIDRLYRRRTEQEEKRRLIQQMGSPSNGFALEAVRILRLEGWLQDGSLEGVCLRKADLTDAELVNAYLVGANLNSAILGKADLNSADLRGAKLRSATLDGAKLIQEIKLEGADFTGATLTGASLQGACLEGVNITVGQLREVAETPDGLRGTTLPDGKLLPYKDDVSYDKVLEEFEAWCKEQEQK